MDVLEFQTRALRPAQSLYRPTPHLFGIFQFGSNWELVLVALLAITAVSALVTIGRTDPRATISLICLGAAALTFAIDVTLFELSIFRLPNARTGVMFAPLLTVGLIAPLFSPHRPNFSGWSLQLSEPSACCLSPVSPCTLANGTTTLISAKQWRRRATMRNGTTSPRLQPPGSTWLSNFYLQYLGYPIEKLQAVKHLTPGGSIYFVAPPPFPQDGIIEKAGLQVIYTSPQSGIRVAAKPLDQ